MHNTTYKINSNLSIVIVAVRMEVIGIATVDASEFERFFIFGIIGIILVNSPISILQPLDDYIQ
jgi:hypothetical protein